MHHSSVLTTLQLSERAHGLTVHCALCSYFTNTTKVQGAKVNAAPVMPNNVVMKTQLWGIVTSVSGGEPTVAA